MEGNMLRRIASLSLILFASLLAIGNKVNKVALLGEDAIPQKINYQGYLTDNTGNPINGTRTMTFKIYDAASGGNELWSETKTVSVENGLFNVILGEVNPISPDIFTPGARRWLELVVEGNPLSPRTEITAVGFSYKTVDADKLEGNSLSDLDGRYVNENQGDAISNAMIQNNAVTTAKIADGNVTLGKINTTGSSAGQAIISTGSGTPPTWGNPTPASHTHSLTHTGDVTGSGDVPGSWALTIANGAVTTAKIQDGAVTNPKLGGNAVTSDKIQDGQVQTADIADGNVTLGKINTTGSSAGQAIISTGSGTPPTWGNPTPASHTHSLSHTGDVTGSGDVPGSWALTIANGAVTTAKIQDGAVTNPKLAANAVTTDKIQDGQVQTADIADGAVTNPKLAANAVTTDKIQDLTITGSDIANSTIGPEKLTFTPGNITGSGTADYVPRWTAATTLGNSSIQDAGGGNIAVGGAPVAGTRIYAYSGLTYGVYGVSASATGMGTVGWNTNTSGTGIIGIGNNLSGTYLSGGSGGAFTGTVAGAFGTSASATGFGIYGINTNSSGTGIIGIGNNTTGSYLSSGSGGAFTGTVAGAFGTSASATGFGIYGTNTNSSGTGIIGIGNNTGGSYPTAGSGGAFTGTSCGVFGRANNTSGARMGGYFYEAGGNYAYVAYHTGSTAYKIYGTGTVSTIMNTREGRKTLFAPEMPEAYFEDVGEGQLINGKCRINLDPLFLDCIIVNEQYPLRVFVQLEDDCNGVYVKKDRTGFDVYELQNGRSNARFSYRVLGKWKGYENLRFPDAPGPLPTEEVKSEIKKVEAKPVSIPKE
jgi:hypothetical protein